MKRLQSLIFIVLLFGTGVLFAQQRVALHSNGTTTIFAGANPFTDAYIAAADGDTIYLPGGTIPYPATINKGLVIIGAGHYPDSTLATGKTVLTGNLGVSQNADKLWLEGIEITGDISFVSNHKVDSVTITRCRFVNLVYSGSGGTPCVDNNVFENVITGSVNFGNATSSMLSNNIIGGQISYANNIGISNNILFHDPSSIAYYSALFLYSNTCLISNNIILRNNGGGSNIYHECNLNSFINNIFRVVPNTGTNTFITNYNSVDIATVFVNQSGNVFGYTQDYHLVNPATYLGIDGTQVGIYGGMFPYKDGAVPHNPHIQLKNIAPITDENGELQIQIQVEAQDY